MAMWDTQMKAVVLFEILVVWPPIPVNLGSGYLRDKIQWHSRRHEPAVWMVGAIQVSHVVSTFNMLNFSICVLGSAVYSEGWLARYVCIQEMELALALWMALQMNSKNWFTVLSLRDWCIAFPPVVMDCYHCTAISIYHASHSWQLAGYATPIEPIIILFSRMHSSNNIIIVCV